MLFAKAHCRHAYELEFDKEQCLGAIPYKAWADFFFYVLMVISNFR